MLIVEETEDYNIWLLSCAFGAILPMAPQRRDQRVLVPRASHDRTIPSIRVMKYSWMANGERFSARVREEILRKEDRNKIKKKKRKKRQEEVVRTDRET